MEEFRTARRRARAELAPCLRDVRAVVFDTDGVLVDSAKLHAAAWKEAFDACLRSHPPDDPAQRRPFDEREDYRRYVDGKSRLDGALAFLESRGLRLPEGEVGEEPGTGSVRAVAADKERRFVARLHASGAQTWPGTVRLLRQLRAAGIPCAAVSASRHARELLEKAGLTGLFRTVVDGQDAARLGLRGKPDPALFLEAARQLEVTAATTAVVEDALAGVEAGRRGGFGVVVGVDRAATPDSARDLREHGADVVVGDLAELLTVVAGSTED
ncbi:HAD family hydrolase [Streptomyces purpurogeneiscleroticus]|uniref:HAD family hydrolase n=1 Tax=Streptomyces purpurogeneiscleroticus TaxID=68259 RepID=UPI001CBB0ABB|nr:HAD-IA family hydrolase [Streptomyces purpurogeneiscleroticus]MBZ4019644.1 hydrolase [Streptomyces purpurogeneiscleroticus]